MVPFRRTPGRRSLRFEQLGDIVAEVERLADGHRVLGNWTLAQMCYHLAGTQEFSVEPGEPAFTTSWLFRATVGRVALRALLWFRYIPEGQGTLPPLPPAELGPSLERLRGTVQRISTEPMIARHPIFGSLSQEQWRKFHLHHAAHHLSFVIPSEATGDAQP
jgi:hypothetical protein